MRSVMRVSGGGRAVCKISQQKYYYRHRAAGAGGRRKKTLRVVPLPFVLIRSHQPRTRGVHATQTSVQVLSHDFYAYDNIQPR